MEISEGGDEGNLKIDMKISVYFAINIFWNTQRLELPISKKVVFRF